ncbi:hypothetical protein B0J15DRAFT_489676 [Fusarium solani]|uniref:Luciferase domain-containing protein n=1 Tax=Fusarium solani TaxID=169388 RepID=A0A9P9HUT6_FUSSL|nr:uncharacterized protein B0J15DRAFT_489676 [Fusarium solani]KAH7263990.1 hypothetical protein B0J15DRAFT_489676 [Fusarium solani]
MDSITMTSHFQSLFQRIASNQRVVATALAATFIGVPVLRAAVLDYREYIKIGPGGVPYNVFGWLIQLCLRPITKEPFHTSCYDGARAIKEAGPNASSAFLSEGDVPVRCSPRPEVGRWTVPSRQLTDLGDEEVKKRYHEFLESLVSSSPSQLKIAQSFAEGRGPALFIASDGPLHPVAWWTRKEITHMHASDGSMHLNLAPKDAKLVLERGWGQRHPLSGRMLYTGLLMIYAPRGEEELEVVKRITKASIRFMLGEEA